MTIYALNDDTKVKAKDDSEKVLRKVVEDMLNSHEIIIAGDLNARVGKKITNKIAGLCRKKVVNDNSEKLINFVRNLN